MIKSIVLDFGNVIYKISANAAVSKFINLNNNINPSIFQEKFGEILNIIHSYESGNLDTRAFRDTICSMLHIKISDDEFDDIWNTILIDLFDYSEESIEKLSNKFDLYLLSNTNEIHYNKFYPKCEVVFSRFKQLFLSYQIKMIKPNEDIYQFVLERANILPDEALFADDLLANISTAKKLGFHTELISDSFTLKSLTEKYSNT